MALDNSPPTKSTRYLRKIGRGTEERALGSLSAFITMLLVRFRQLIQVRITWKEGNSIEKIPPSYWPVGKAVGEFY